jgi:hypothetical protein
MPALVIDAEQVDFLLGALQAAADDLRAGRGPDPKAPARPRRRPVRESTTA